jgi:hypothetical protein
MHSTTWKMQVKFRRFDEAKRINRDVNRFHAWWLNSSHFAAIIVTTSATTDRLNIHSHMYMSE